MAEVAAEAALVKEPYGKLLRNNLNIRAIPVVYLLNKTVAYCALNLNFLTTIQISKVINRKQIQMKMMKELVTLQLLLCDNLIAKV